jgi:hypothetical protein
MIIDRDAVQAGWYYDSLHHQPVYLFWNDADWRARFVSQDPNMPSGRHQREGIRVQDELLTPAMYHRLIPLGTPAIQDYTVDGGCAIREMYGMRRLVQVKPGFAGNGVFIQAPAADDRGQCDPLCQVVWLLDDEIPTIIRALQARRRAVLDSGGDTSTAHPAPDQP